MLRLVPRILRSRATSSSSRRLGVTSLERPLVCFSSIVGVLGDNSEFDDQRLKKKEYEILTRRQSQIVVIRIEGCGMGD
jgi:hypothetical protein